MVIILYIDDYPIVATSTSSSLTRCGHTAIGALSGEKGLEILAQTNQVDIIFSDFNMRTIDGYDFSKAVKTDIRYSKHSKVPIVGVGEFPFEKREYLVECLEKPIEFEELLRCIEQYCR